MSESKVGRVPSPRHGRFVAVDLVDANVTEKQALVYGGWVQGSRFWFDKVRLQT